MLTPAIARSQAGVMVLFAIASHIAPAALVGIFTNAPAVIAIGEEHLRIVSWNYVASGLIFVASSMFQAMGNTVSSLIASGVRLFLIAVPAVILSRLPSFHLNTIWYLSVAAVFVQLSLMTMVTSKITNRSPTTLPPPRNRQLSGVSQRRYDGESKSPARLSRLTPRTRKSVDC